MKKIAVDTNVLVRILVNEQSDQGRIAERLLSSCRIYISRTVLLESEWVMRSAMKIERRLLSGMMQSMLRLEAIEIEHAADVAIALDAYAAGMDFADALHVSGAFDADAFLTFDRALARRAKQHIAHVSVELAQ